jgi:dihydrodipicolinate reductase
MNIVVLGARGRLGATLVRSTGELLSLLRNHSEQR